MLRRPIPLETRRYWRVVITPIHSHHHVANGEDKEAAHGDSKGTVEHVDNTMVELQETYLKPGILHAALSCKNATARRGELTRLRHRAQRLVSV